MNIFYYRIVTNPPRCGEYSLPIMIETDKPNLTNQEVLQHCIDNKEFHRDPDQFYVTKIEQIDYPEYHDMIQESYL